MAQAPKQSKYVEFNGELDPVKPAFVEFKGELDEEKSTKALQSATIGDNSKRKKKTDPVTVDNASWGDIAPDEEKATVKGTPVLSEQEKRGLDYATAKDYGNVVPRTGKYGAPVDTVLPPVERQDIENTLQHTTDPAGRAVLQEQLTRPAEKRTPTLNANQVKNLPIEQQLEEGPFIENAPGVEATPGNIVTGLAMSLPQGLDAARQGIRGQFADVIGSEEMAADANREYQRIQSDVAASTPEIESPLFNAVYGGLASTLRQAPGMAAAIATRSAVPALAAAGLQTEAESYAKYKERGATGLQAAIGALGEGGIEVLTELTPMRFLVDRYGKTKASRLVAEFIAKDAAPEQVATLTQDAIDTAIANPDKTWGDYLAERPRAAFDTLIATVIQAGAIGGASAIAQRMQQRAGEINDTFATGKQAMADDAELSSIKAEADQINATAPGTVNTDAINAEIERRAGLGTLARAAETAVRETAKAAPVETLDTMDVLGNAGLEDENVSDTNATAELAAGAIEQQPAVAEGGVPDIYGGAGSDTVYEGQPDSTPALEQGDGSNIALGNESAAQDSPVTLDVNSEEVSAPPANDEKPRRPVLPESYSIGPASAFTKPIGKTVYRETNGDGLDRIIMGSYSNNASGGDVFNGFVADNPDLAIGQGDNKGIKIQFRGDAVSGQEHIKPGTGDIAGREYKTDFIGMDAINQILVEGSPRIRGLTKRFLSQYFDSKKLPDGRTLFTRKGEEVGDPLDSIVDIKTEQSTPVDENIQPQIDAKAETESPVRPLVESLVKRRAAAQQINKEKIFDNVLAAAKDLMAGKPVKANKFKNWSVFFNSDPQLRDVVMGLYEAANETPEAIAAKSKASAQASARAKAGKQIDTTKDNVLVAMAKLGGLKKDAAISEFGFDPADMKQHGAGIFRSFVNSKNAKDLDSMREALAELGYPVGETVADFGNALSDAMGGFDVMTPEGIEAKSIAELEERYQQEYNELSEQEQVELDALVSEASALFGADKVSGIDAAIAAQLTGQPVAAAERKLMEVLREANRQAREIVAREGSQPAVDAADSQDAAGEPGQDSETGSAETGNAAEPESLTLTGQTEAEIAADEKAKADQRKADDEAQQRAKADTQVNDFTLTGSDRPADQAAARGAQDLFSPSSAKPSSSWVIRNKETGEVILETFDRNKVDALNTKKYEAVPIAEYLASLNDKSSAKQWDGLSVAKRKEMLDTYFGKGQTDAPDRYGSRSWNSLNTGERSTITAVIRTYQNKQAEPADLNDRDRFTIQRINGDGVFENVTFSRGETVKVAGGYPMVKGEIAGISHAEKQVKVNSVWYDFGYIYKADHDEFANPRDDINKILSLVETRLNDANSIEADDIIRQAKILADRYKLNEFNDRFEQLRLKAIEVRDAIRDNVERKKPITKTEDASTVPSPGQAAIQMTMEEWKAVHKDFKGTANGSRSIMRDGRLVPVEIIKQNKNHTSVVTEKQKNPKTALTDYDNAMNAYRNGSASLDEYQAAFNYVVSNEQAITEYLEANFTKAQLMDRFMDRFDVARYKTEPKARIVQAAYSNMVRDFLLPNENGMVSSSYGFRGDKYGDIKRQVGEITQESLDRAMQRRKERIKEYEAKKDEQLKGIDDPKTLDDYTNALRTKMAAGKTLKEARLELTPDQRARYDELASEKTISERSSRKEAQQTSVAVAGQTVDGNIIETKHTQKGHDLFVVQLSERVSKEDYNTLNAGAKKLGGHYSSFRGGGAVPGFQFKTRGDAEAFVQLAGGNSAAAQEVAKERRNAFEDDKSQTAVERLTEMADRLEEKSSNALNRERKVNTHRRAGMAARAEAVASAEKALAVTMRNIASAIESGKAKFLGKVRQKVQVELLQSIAKTAQDERLRSMYPGYGDYVKHKDMPLDQETADYAEFPSYTMYRSDLAKLGRAMIETEGLKSIGSKILSVADDVSKEYIEFAKKNLLSVQTFSTKEGQRPIFTSKANAEEAIARSGFKGKAVVLPSKRGENLIILSPAEAMQRGIWQGEDKRITLNGDFAKDVVEKIGKVNRRNSKIELPWQFETAYDKREKLRRMGIENPHELRAALREFIGLREEAAQPDKIKQMERSMIGRQNDGLDFFPTPASVADEMVDTAGIQEGMSVLEPSAGMGHIADRIREAGAEPDVVELSANRRELLEAKGFNVVASDFMDVTEKYDRIIMNPPFSDRRDEQHVRHAYELLKPGGRLVAIMGEGVFFGSDARASTFRDWLESVNGTSEKLQEGTFLDPTLPVTTGVNARMVVIDKDEQAPEFSRSKDLSKGNTAAWSRDGAAQGMTFEKVQSQVDAIKAEWGNAPPVVVVTDMEDPKIPEAVRQQNASQLSQGASGQPAGFFFQGKVYVVASEASSSKHVTEVMFHEALGHFGLRGVYGKALDNILDDIYIARRAEVLKKAKEYGLDFNDAAQRRYASEEVLAEMAQTNPQLGFVKRAIAAIRTWLRKNIKAFRDLKLTDDEIIQNFLMPARDFVQRQGKQESEAGLVPAFSRQDQTTTPEFKKWFGDSKVVDADGKPLVVYRGEHGNNDGNPRSLLGSITFTDDPSVASTYAQVPNDMRTFSYAESPRVIPAFLSIKNPIINSIDDPFVDFSEIQAKLGSDAARRMARKHSDAIQNTGNWQENYSRNYASVDDLLDAKPEAIGDLYMDAYRLLDDFSFVREAKEAGFDGAIHVGTGESMDALEYRVFHENQIKSAMGNRGTFDSSNPDIRFSRTGSQPGWQSPDASKMDNVIYALQDKNVDLKRVTKAIRDAGKEIESRWDAYLQEELYHGRTAKRVQDFIEQELDPLIEAMRKQDVTMADFEEYLWARHAEERNEQIAKINPDLPDGGSGMTTAEAKAYLAGLDAKTRKTYETLAKRVDAINHNSRQVLVDYGIESPETIAAWEGAYTHYVPLMREDMDTGFSGNGTGQGYSVKGNSSKRATGSQRAVVDILANIAQQREKNIIRGEKNRVSTALIGLAKLNQNPDFWKVDEVPRTKQVVPGRTVYEIEFHGSKVHEATNLAAANAFVAYQGKPGYTIKPVKQGEQVMDVPDPNYKSRDNVIVARVPNKQGKIIEHAVVFNQFDERAMRMARSLKNLDQDQMGEILSMSASVTRYFASINTQYNPIFGMINILRDAQGSVLNLTSTPLAGKQAAVMAKTLPAMRGIYQNLRGKRKGNAIDTEWAREWEEFQKEGGQTGYRDMFRNARERGKAIEHALDPQWWAKTKAGKVLTAGGTLTPPVRILNDAAVKPLFNWLEDYNETFENAVRLAAYKTAKENGMSKQEAASLAKNISVNFNRKGEMGRQIGSLYAFFNASVQGTARIAETLKGPAGKRIIAGGVLLGVVQALALAAAGFGDDEPPEFVRDRSVILPIGDGKYLTFPLPLGFNVLPAVGRIITEWALAGGRDTGKRATHLIEVFMDMFNPIGNAGMSMQTLAPTTLDPLVALTENKDWTGRPIAKQDFNSLDPTPGFSRSRDKAWEASVQIAKAINWITGGTDFKPGAISPTADQLEYLAGQLTGGVGREAIKLGTTADALTTGENLPPHKVPLLGRFYGDASGQSAQGNQFYENLRKMHEHENEIVGRRKTGGDVAGYRSDNPEANLVAQAKLAEKVVGKLKKRRRMLVESGADREAIKAIDDRITDHMRRFNERVKGAREKEAA